MILLITKKISVKFKVNKIFLRLNLKCHNFIRIKNIYKKKFDPHCHIIKKNKNV